MLKLSIIDAHMYAYSCMTTCKYLLFLFSFPLNFTLKLLKCIWREIDQHCWYMIVLIDIQARAAYNCIAVLHTKLRLEWRGSVFVFRSAYIWYWRSLLYVL